jgi:hypothetical protein
LLHSVPPSNPRTRRKSPCSGVLSLVGAEWQRTIAGMSKPIGVAGFSRVALMLAALASGVWACSDEPGPLQPARLPDAGGQAGGEPAPSADAGQGGTTGFVVLPETGGSSGVILGRSCSPGATRACQLDALCSGQETCSADGAGFGACDCGNVPLIGTGIVGAACQSDSDCDGGATCLRADENEYLGAGGPARGYCSSRCTVTADCQGLDPESRCVPLGPQGAPDAEGDPVRDRYCIRTCLSKAAEPGEAKCLNRADLACVSVVADRELPLAAERQDGYCAPRCGSDSDCPTGRVCHLQAGICTDVQAPGATAGASCRLTTECNGLMCEDLEAGVGTCTSLCVLGSLDACGFGRDAILRDAACLGPLVSAGRFSEAEGDLGLCQEVCDVDADCQRAAEGWVCRALNPALAEFIGRSGACDKP